HDGVADLSGDGEADARSVAITALQHFQKEKPPAALFTTPDGQELRPLAQPRRSGLPGLAGFRQSGAFVQAESRLRPRLRRAATTPRPPLVAMRARKPCRRLRTSFDG